jgi:porin
LRVHFTATTGTHKLQKNAAPTRGGACQGRLDLSIAASFLGRIGAGAWRRCVMLGLATLPMWPAAAQTLDGSAGNGSASPLVLMPTEAQAPAAIAPQVEHLFGDLGGVRTHLENHGVYLLLNATAEFAGNVSGGTKQGATSANQIAFEADIDWQRLAGLTGLSTHVIMVNRSGASDSMLFGDNVSPVQEIYGSGGNVAVHLVSAYAEQVFLDSKLDIAAGWMNVENDFASSPLYCNYMNNGLCGDPKALPGGDIGHSAFPDAVWAARVRVRPIPEFYVTTGVYEVNKGLYSDLARTGFEFGVPREQGVYVPVQFGCEPKLGRDAMPGHYVLGFGYDSSRFESFSSALTAGSGVPAAVHYGNTQFWALADQMLMRNGSGDQDGIIALGGMIANNAENSAYAQQYYAGVLDRAFWPARPQDTIALLYSYFAMSGPLGKVQAQEQAFGLPFSNAASGVQTNEMFLEANYNIHVFRGVNFQPDFQYVIRPNAQASIRNAVVLGFRANVQF